MAEQENDKARDLATILEDVKTIKAILQNQDAPFPPLWRLIYFVAFPALAVIALLKFFVPALAAMNYLDTFLWLWLPVWAVAAVIMAVVVRLLVKNTGTRFLAQSRVQFFLSTRFVVAPAVLILGYLLSLNAAYSLEGAMAVLVSMGVSGVIVLLPKTHRFIPFVFLVGGGLELMFDLRGAVWTLVNTLVVAAAFLIVANAVERVEHRAEGR